jgi:hypothetical protein
MEAVIEIGGAVLILAAFIAAQRGTLSPQSQSYLVLNLVGSAILAVIALVESRLGFLLLEGVWALVSAWGLALVLTGRAPRAAH